MNGLSNLKNGFNDISSYAPIAGAAVLAFGKFSKDAINDTVAYAKQVEDLSRLIGATPEDASKLIQAADDMRVSYDSLSTAMEAAIRKGFDPSIAGLQDIRKKYQDIQDPIEQSKYLMDTFGRSGADMAPLLKLSSDELANLATQADKAGLALSGKNLDDARAYAKAMDDLDDSIMGVKVAFSKEVIPAIVEFMNNGQAVNEAIDRQKLKWMDLIPALGGVARALLWINELNGAGAPSGATTRNQAISLVNESRLSSADKKNLLGGYANGADFIVPPGYPNDTFPMRVQSGERVQVTPAGQQSMDMRDVVRELRRLPAAFRDAMLLGEQ